MIFNFKITFRGEAEFLRKQLASPQESALKKDRFFLVRKS